MKAASQCLLILIYLKSLCPREHVAVPIVGGRVVSSVGSIREEVGFKEFTNIRIQISDGFTKYPFMVSLQDVLSGSPNDRNSTEKRAYQHFCGGSLINERWILTAAHCVWRKHIGKIAAFIGHENIENVHNLDSYSIDKAEYIYFQPSNYRNDIALLHLSRPFESNLAKDLQFAQLPPHGMTTNSTGLSTNGLFESPLIPVTPNSEPCRIIGYGATRHAGPSQNKLAEAEVRIIDNQQCREIIGHIWAPKNGANTVCALGKNQDSCQGDSGGPLLCPYGPGGGEYIYGLVSHGLTCGIEGVPSIYTVTRPYYDWVQLLVQN